jgi:tRNA(Ile)-lysidine synthase
MKNLSPIAYRTLFFKHVWRFLGNVLKPHELNASCAVAVSGGLDSMALLWFINSLYKQGKVGPVRAIFAHHHTRPGQDDDLAMIKKFCQTEGIPLKALDIKDLSLTGGNFEQKARQKRRQLILGELKENELIFVGHHIDDSYEWNMMQRHRATSPKSMLGIPVRNGPIVRPFLCVTKAQIKKLAKFEDIPYREDPTNWDLKYDRNYVRHEIIPKIKKRYPKYLKHYAQLANFSALTLNVSVISKIHGAKIYAFEQGAAIEGVLFSEVQVQELIHTYSNTDRGEIISQIVKMQKAIDNDKKGPFHFSGGMEAYYTYHLLMIYNQSMKNHDSSVAKALTLLSVNQLAMLPSFTQKELEITWANLLKTSDALQNLPGLVLVLEPENVRKTLNTSVFDTLFPLTSKVCKEKGLRFMTATKCLDVWKNKSKKLPEKLRLLPLWNLANLFPSQG